MAVSVLVPCLNEAENLPSLVRTVRAALARPTVLGPGELVIVDDGSSDRTQEVLSRLDVRAVRHPRKLGIPAAWSSGLAAAQGEHVCVLDADLQYDPGEIPRLCEVLKTTGADLVQGARTGRTRDVRWVVSRGLNIMLNGLFRMTLADNKSGFFVCRRDVLTDLLGDRSRFRHFQCLVMVAARHRGYRVVEVPTPFRARRAGASAFGQLPLVPTLEVAADLVQALRLYGRGA